MTNLNVDQIHQLFGKPLSSLPMQRLPFQWNKRNVIITIVVLGFAAYGAYSLTREIREWAAGLSDELEKNKKADLKK